MNESLKVSIDGIAVGSVSNTICTTVPNNLHAATAQFADSSCSARQTDGGIEIHEITGEDLKRLKKKLRYEVSKEYGMYIVQAGDTLSEIGVGVGHPWRVLAKFNNLENPHLIFPGQIIKLR